MNFSLTWVEVSDVVASVVSVSLAAVSFRTESTEANSNIIHEGN